MKVVPRRSLLDQIRNELAANPVVALLGPRQCGKTTLARRIEEEAEECEFFDLEDAADLARLTAPKHALDPLEGLVILDEVQRKPEIFELLRVLADRPDHPARFLLLGSASPQLVKDVSESLAGRIGFVDMAGFQLDEIEQNDLRKLWLRGGLPRSFLSGTNAASLKWRQNFIRTFLERDLPQLGLNIPAETLRRFWTMIAHYHGQIWNGAEFARSLGSSEPTARRYLDILCGAYMVRALAPWHENLKKRQVKSPKIYIRDTGLLHALLSIEGLRDLQAHPKLGGSWEGFAIEQTLQAIQTRDTYFWATHSGAELDLLVFLHGRRYGFEVKYTDAPTMTKSLSIAMDDLGLEAAWIIYPGEKTYPLEDNINVVPLAQIGEVIEELK